MKTKAFHSLILVLLITACTPSSAPADTSNTPVALPSSTTLLSTPTLIPTSTRALPTSTLESEQDKGQSKGPSEVAIAASTTATSNAYLVFVTNTPPPAPGPGIVADHSTIAQFAQIPRSAITAAAARKTLFMHQSTGGLIDGSGMGCLAGLEGDPNYGYPQECATYAANRAANVWPFYDKANLNWEMWPQPQADAIAKTDQFVNVVHAQAANYQVIGMKYCYVDGWNQSENVNQSYYINKMLALERQYPGKIFIWTTSAVLGHAADSCNALFNKCQQIAEFNQQVRAYALAHNKPLYDIAAIESHDHNGNPCTVGGYEGMCAEWYADSGGHPNIAGSIRLAKGFWWLMARISGWNGAASAKSR